MAVRLNKDDKGGKISPVGQYFLDPIKFFDNSWKEGESNLRKDSQRQAKARRDFQALKQQREREAQRRLHQSRRALFDGQGRAMEGRGMVDAQRIEGPRDFMSFLEEAKKYLGGAIMPDFSEARNAANERYRTNDAKLQAIYDQLKSSILADEGGIKKNYADAGEAYDETADTAKANIKDAYDSARSAQAAELSALGIEEAAANNAAKQGGGAVADEGAAITGIEQNRAANQDRNTAHSASAVNYNTSIGQAAGVEGADRRANLAADLSRYLGELSMKEQQARAEAEARQQNAVMSLAQALSGDYWNMQDREAQGEQAALEQAMRQRQMELDYDLKSRELDSKGDTGSPYDFAGSLQSYYDQLKKQYGNKLSEEDIWKRALQLAQGTGKYYG